MRQISHPNCVNLYDFEETDQEISFVIEYMGGGSLRDAMDTFGTFPERLLGGYMRDVLEGLEYLHSVGVVHRDIKAGNILLTNDGRCKLADFGSCCLVKEMGHHLSIVGSPYWMSPEMVEGKASGSGKSDVWSLGITLIELMWGHPPHYEKTKMQAMVAIVDLPLPPWAYEELSDEMNDFLVGCFIKIELFRPAPKDLLDHPWVVEACSGEGVGGGEGGDGAGDEIRHHRSLPYEHFHDLRKMKEREEEEEEEEEEEGSSADLSSCPKTPKTEAAGGGEGGEDSSSRSSSSSTYLKPGGKGGEEDDEAETVSEYTLCSEKEEDDGEGASFGSPRKGGIGGASTPTRLREMGRCDSDSRLHNKVVVSGPGSRSPDKSPSKSPKQGPKGGMDKKDSRLLAFHNISKNQFRQHAPLTVKRSRFILILILILIHILLLSLSFFIHILTNLSNSLPLPQLRNGLER